MPVDPPRSPRCRRRAACARPSAPRRAAARCDQRHASRPSAASPTTSRSGSLSRIMRKPGRTSAWSSTSTTADHGASASGKRARTRQPPPGRGPAVSVPPNMPTRSRMPTSPCPPAPLRDAALPRPSSRPRRRRRRRQRGGRRRRRRRARRAAYVGQRLLDDPVGAERRPPAGAGRAEVVGPRCARSTGEVGGGVDSGRGSG